MNEMTFTCARHPSVETGLKCASCGTPICPSCLVQTPVGMKCKSCASHKRHFALAFASAGLAWRGGCASCWGDCRVGSGVQLWVLYPFRRLCLRWICWGNGAASGEPKTRHKDRSGYRRGPRNRSARRSDARRRDYAACARRRHRPIRRLERDHRPRDLTNTACSPRDHRRQRSQPDKIHLARFIHNDVHSDMPLSSFWSISPVLPGKLGPTAQ